MRILIVGAGATGGFYGGRLAQIGRDVTFLVRPARAEKLRRDGLEIISPLGDATIQPQLITADELRANPQSFDLVLLATKSYSLEQAIEDFAPAVGPETTILPILNGMRQLDLLDARFGPERVLGGTCRINSDVDAEGRILQLSTLGDLTFGERNGAAHAAHRAHQQPNSAARSSKPCSLPMSSPRCGTSGTSSQRSTSSASSHAAPWRGRRCPARPRLRQRRHRRVHRDRRGQRLSSAGQLIEWDRKRLTEPGSDLTSSMYRDMMKNAPVEADHIIGDLLARGEAHSVAAPLLRATYVQLKVYEAQRAGTT